MPVSPLASGAAAPGSRISATLTRIVAVGLVEVAKTLRATVETREPRRRLRVTGAAPAVNCENDATPPAAGWQSSAGSSARSALRSAP